jgi:hypothetical protein
MIGKPMPAEAEYVEFSLDVPGRYQKGRRFTDYPLSIT